VKQTILTTMLSGISFATKNSAGCPHRARCGVNAVQGASLAQ